jgi:hypothetical protein
MNWTVLIPIIAQYGLPLAENLYQRWASGSPPTQADFDQLRAMAGQTATDRMKAALASAGIPLEDPKAQVFLALAK